MVTQQPMKLSTYMERTGMSVRDLAIKLSVTRVTVHRWLSETRRPGWRHLGLISEVTGGEVTALDFVERDTTKRSHNQKAA